MTKPFIPSRWKPKIMYPIILIVSWKSLSLNKKQSSSKIFPKKQALDTDHTSWLILSEDFFHSNYIPIDIQIKPEKVLGWYIFRGSSHTFSAGGPGCLGIFQQNAPQLFVCWNWWPALKNIDRKNIYMKQSATHINIYIYTSHVIIGYW